MTRLIFLAFTLFCLLNTSLALADPIQDQIARLFSADVATTLDAARELGKDAEKVVPELASQLEVDIKITPSNEPGTGGTMYIGHGGCPGCYPFLSYGLNQSQVRVGWMLEQLAFVDFGFEANAYQELTLQQRHDSVSRARAWWKEQSGDWTRLRGLREAIFSDSGQRQARALWYLRQPDSPCPGLTEAYVTGELLPRIKQIAGAMDGIAKTQAVELVKALPNGHCYNIDGVAPGNSANELQAEWLPRVTCKAGEVQTVEGDCLWEGDRLVLPKGCTTAEIQAHVAFDPLWHFLTADVEYASWVGENCESAEYVYFVESRLANKPGAEWQILRTARVETEYGDLILDVLQDGRIGGVELIFYEGAEKQRLLALGYRRA